MYATTLLSIGCQHYHMCRIENQQCFDKATHLHKVWYMLLKLIYSAFSEKTSVDLVEIDKHKYL